MLRGPMALSATHNLPARAVQSALQLVEEPCRNEHHIVLAKQNTV